MRDGGWIWLAVGIVFCLATTSRPTMAAPATQPATQSQPAREETRLELDASAYPPGITNPDQYEQYLANKLRDASNQLLQQSGPASQHLGLSLEIAAFALMQAAEPDLTRIWLWRQPQAKPDLAARALDVAARALSGAERLVQSAKQDPNASQYTDMIQRLTALLAMEKALLRQADPDAALHAAELADAVWNTVPQAGQPTWDLLIAACLDKASRKDDALLRLQRILRQHRNSPTAPAAVMLQSRILAEAGNYPAAVALVSEYLQVIPATGQDPATQPAVRIVQCTFSWLKADLLEAWVNKLDQSDHRTASQLRTQAVHWQSQAEESGPYVLRLQPLLRTLDSTVQ